MEKVAPDSGNNFPQQIEKQLGIAPLMFHLELNADLNIRVACFSRSKHHLKATGGRAELNSQYFIPWCNTTCRHFYCLVLQTRCAAASLSTGARDICGTKISAGHSIFLTWRNMSSSARARGDYGYPMSLHHSEHCCSSVR